KRGYCAIGTVKSNLGHLDAAAGLTGLVKTVLALEHREIRPSLHFQRPSPAIDFAASPFYVADRLTPWLDTDRLLRLAGVSSFGIGGTNAHVVVEEAPASPAPDPSRALQMLVLSAKSSLALEQMTDNLVEHLDGHPELCLADVAFTLLEGRARWHHRRALVCHDLADARSALALRDPERILTQAPDGAAGRVVFLFPGTGAQYAGMGRELYRSEPVFKQELDRCLDVLAPRLKCDLRPVFELERESSAGTLLLRRTSCVMSALFAIEISLAHLWVSWGVEPQAMVGHSLGEFAAACLAGVMTLEDAAALVVLRVQLLETLPEGGMLSVALPEAELLLRLADGLSVAAVNGP